MTDNHPISPPPELVEQWIAEIWHEGTPVRVAVSDLHIATQAAQWAHEQLLEAKEADLQKARDEELDACVEWLGEQYSWATAERMRDARRCKPLSLKEQALEAHERATFGRLGDCDIIRQALEQLPD